MICKYRGFDLHKKVNGRKGQLLVDTGGYFWATHVHAANDNAEQMTLVLVRDIFWSGDQVEKVFDDGLYGCVFCKSSG